MSNPWVIVALLAALAGAGLQGYRMGYRACEAAHNAAELKAIADFEAEKARRIVAEANRAKLARELEVLNNEEDVVVTQCLGPSRLRLLNRVNE